MLTFSGGEVERPALVTDADEDSDHGTGLSFPPTAEGLADGLQRSLRLYADKARLTAVA